MPSKKSTSRVKPTVKKRTLNSGGQPAHSEGSPFNDQDVKRRLGNFESAGEHARQGGRQQGIVGQTRRKFKTDKRG